MCHLLKTDSLLLKSKYSMKVSVSSRLKVLTSMVLSCFHYDSLLCTFFTMQKSLILVTLPENAIYYLNSHLKTTVKLDITVCSEVSEYNTLNMYVSHVYWICSLQF